MSCSIIIIKKKQSDIMPATAIHFCRVVFLMMEISAAKVGLYFEILKTAIQIKIKLANMEMTIISIPKNISEAK